MTDFNYEGDSPTGAVSVHTATIAAQNTFMTGFKLFGRHNLSISGTLAASTVTVQRSFDNGTTWLDVDTYTAPTQGVINEPEPNVMWRAGIKTGQYGGSDSVDIRISK